MSCSWCVREAQGLRMEPSSWQVHFRNRYIIRRDWRALPFSGTMKGGPVSPVFLLERNSGRRDGGLPLLALRKETRQAASLREDRCKWSKSLLKTCYGPIKFDVGDELVFAACSAWSFL